MSPARWEYCGSLVWQFLARIANNSLKRVQRSGILQTGLQEIASGVRPTSRYVSIDGMGSLNKQFPPSQEYETP
jgi:hypothetical protein